MSVVYASAIFVNKNEIKTIIMFYFVNENKIEQN